MRKIEVREMRLREMEEKMEEREKGEMKEMEEKENERERGEK